MTTISGVQKIVVELRNEKTNLTNQLRHVDAALSVLGKLHDKLEVTGGNGPSRKGRRLSAAARRKISLAQKARWAKVKSSNGTEVKGEASSGNGQSPKGNRMSAVARKRISQAQKRRWAKIKSGKKK